MERRVDANLLHHAIRQPEQNLIAGEKLLTPRGVGLRDVAGEVLSGMIPEHIDGEANLSPKDCATSGKMCEGANSAEILMAIHADSKHKAE